MIISNKNQLSNLTLFDKNILAKKNPCNLEAEKAVLGAILFNDEYIVQILEIIASKDFYLPVHKIIFEAMVSIHTRSGKIDTIVLQNELEKKDKLEAIGGVIFLLSLQEDIPSIGLVDQYSKIIKEKSILRELISSCAHIISSCYKVEDDADVNAVLDSAEHAIFQISNKKTEQNFIQLNIWLKKTFQNLSEIKSNNGGITGVTSGYKQLDNFTSGFQSGDLIILAARPSMGKTALALNMITSVVQNGFAAGFFSLEMGAEQLVKRLLSAESGISHQNIRNATISSEEWIELTNVAAQLAGVKLFIDDTAALDILQLRAKARKLKAQEDIKLLVVDYLQLLHTGKRHENRYQEVSEISRALKTLAKELQIPIIALSQLSRAVDARMDKRPMLSDLRESGAIEQDADLIMFLYRDIVYNQETDNPNLAELIIGKQRNGPTGTVNLSFVKEITKFEDFHDNY